MKLIVQDTVLCGGVWYEPDHRPQAVPDNIAVHLLEIGAARKYEEKIVEAKEVKIEKKTSSASQPDQASQEKTPTKRRGRPRKSS